MSEEKIPNAFGDMTPEHAELVAQHNKRGWTKYYTEDGRRYRLEIRARFDDECKNGRASFAITADLYDGRQNIAGGCLHDEIVEHAPELAPLIRWHLFDTAGPMHYVANTVYLAGDRDHYGKRAGEPSAFSHAVQFGENPIKHKLGKRFAEFLQYSFENPGLSGERFDFEVLRIDHDERQAFRPKYTYGGFEARWHECPFDTEPEALDFLQALQSCNPKLLEIPTDWSKGKAREFDAARRAACWPEATDAELSAEPEALKARLLERLPALLAEFRAAMESVGFTWPEGQ